jgi:UDP-N-acetylmuramyl pentapeptide phosphotransferase/UDP-N-acetylglucosamine-1-phosphate transferase
VLGAAAGLAVASALGAPPESRTITLVIAAVGVACVGLIDDVRALRPGPKLLAQTMAAVLVVGTAGPILDTSVSQGLSWEPRTAIAWVISIAWICGVTNFFNFMDGIDGLAAGQGIASLVGVLIAGWASDASLVAVCAVAASIAFLAHNWSPARIFMGDAGSGFLGFLLAALPFLAPDHQRGRAAIAVAIGLTLFLLDPIETLVRRAHARKPLTSAHREHRYQQLVAPGEPAGRVATVLVAIGLVLSIVGAVFFREPAFSWLAAGMPVLAYIIEYRLARSIARARALPARRESDGH